jgi:hypothetical protein
VYGNVPVAMLGPVLATATVAVVLRLPQRDAIVEVGRVPPKLVAAVTCGNDRRDGGKRSTRLTSRHCGRGAGWV